MYVSEIRLVGLVNMFEYLRSISVALAAGFSERGHATRGDAAEFLPQTQSAVVRTRTGADSLLIPPTGLSGPVEQERGLNPVIR